MSEGRVIIHTDGACSGNPGPGGWGAILQWNGQTRELKGAEPHTTNNRMELMAAIMALEALKRPVPIDIHTDSQYLRDGITKWIHGWKRNGWRTADKSPVKNADLWRRLDAALANHQVAWHWVRGHAGHDLNERADVLARAAIADLRAGGKRAGGEALIAALTSSRDVAPARLPRGAMRHEHGKRGNAPIRFSSMGSADARMRI